MGHAEKDNLSTFKTKTVFNNITYLLLHTESANKYPNSLYIYQNNLNPVNSQEFEDIYFMMEGLLVNLYNFKTLPANITHLSKQFDSLKKIIEEEKKEKHVNNDIVNLVCKLFLAIFDTLPIYQEGCYTDEDWRLALTAKKVAGLVLDYRLVMGNIYDKSLNQARISNLKRHKV